MQIRAFTESDLEELKRLHSLHFQHQFQLPDFLKMICAFTIEDDKGIVLFGGVRTIAEGLAITNMNRHTRDRAKALYQLLDACAFVCRKTNYDQMFVWSQDPPYTKRLIRTGFRYPDGQSLILDL